jgi:molybdopterin converting factor small subunit
MRVLLFGNLAERFGSSELEIEGEFRISELRAHLATQAGALPYAVAINGRVENEDRVIPSDAEVALLPPFSGG